MEPMYYIGLEVYKRIIRVLSGLYGSESQLCPPHL